MNILENQEESKKIKNQIFDLVKEYYRLVFKNKQQFIPGQTRINYGGRVFDEKELINLIDSSLEFWLTEGRYTEQFQQKLASFLGIRYCLVTNSGSSANLLALTALTSDKLPEDKRIKPGDEVITVAAGFPTTIFPIIQNNAIPVFVDIELETYNINTSELEDACSDRTKAVILAHTLGNPFNIDKVSKFCRRNHIWLIEDNCDSLGSKYYNNFTGTFGDISTHSFYPAHQITMGEGGAILTSNSELYKIMKSIREWGRDCWCSPGSDNTCKKRYQWQLGTLPYGYDHKYIYSEFGYNLKITDMQAAIGLAQLEKLPDFIQSRRNNHKKIYDGLKKVEEYVILPQAQKNSEPNWFGFALTLKDNRKLNRNSLISKIEKHNIQTRFLFAGNIICQPVFNKMREKKKGFRVIGELTNTNKIMNDSFWFGVYPGLSSEMIEYLIKKIIESFN